MHGAHTWRTHRPVVCCPQLLTRNEVHVIPSEVRGWAGGLAAKRAACTEVCRAGLRLGWERWAVPVSAEVAALHLWYLRN